MNSKSRASFSSRLTEGEKLIEYLNTFTNYNPGEAELTAAAFQTQTTELHAVQEEHTTKHFDYSKAALDRRKLFDKDDESISKLLPPIRANVRGKLGSDSQQYHDIRTLVLKIRGQGRRINITENSKETTISRSEKSYGSQLIYFGDIITLLTKFGDNYKPINDKISLSKLQDLLNNATFATNNVSQKLAVYKPLIASRQKGFIQLSATAKRIKDMILSQYGLDSNEYKMVKGLNI
ncbi:hypothetical protein QWY90_01770 [Flavobacterium paronense]|uniref:Uncharacterized protein n=1 Tax=Flavobacterium paronense TaxID=1392775 RepID=A0ABV5GGW2_9FLAO|nr:hypothetical protein [Flavobacterium paronense]MDN3676034.1 hypothetical protein [Flavobacterium paronense]